jgi:hypothetical protein
MLVEFLIAIRTVTLPYPVTPTSISADLTTLCSVYEVLIILLLKI